MNKEGILYSNEMYTGAPKEKFCNIYHSIIGNSPILETTKMFINIKYLSKYTYIVILCRKENEKKVTHTKKQVSERSQIHYVNTV